VIIGNLLVVPIEDSLLHVQQLYLQSMQTQLKRVIVFYRAPAPAGGQGNAQQVVAMKPTLTEALTAAFGQSFVPGNTSGGTGGTGGLTLNAQARALIAQAGTQFDAAQKALQAGDFAGYGSQTQALQQTLRDLQALQ
jgi:uncharacterized protein